MKGYRMFGLRSKTERRTPGEWRGCYKDYLLDLVNDDDPAHAGARRDALDELRQREETSTTLNVLFGCMLLAILVVCIAQGCMVHFSHAQAMVQPTSQPASEPTSQ